MTEEVHPMDTAVVIYISGMSKGKLIDFLQVEYGGTKQQHKDWLERLTQNKRQSEKLRCMRRCTIARVARTRNVRL